MGMLPTAAVTGKLSQRERILERRRKSTLQKNVSNYKFHKSCWIVLLLFFQLIKSLKCKGEKFLQQSQVKICRHPSSVRNWVFSSTPVRFFSPSVIPYMKHQHLFPGYHALSDTDEAFLTISPLKNILIIYLRVAEMYSLFFFRKKKNPATFSSPIWIT